MYQHHNRHGALLDYPVSKVVRVGDNYANRIEGMSGSTPEESVLLIKPETALCDLRQSLVTPSDMDPVHHEVELAMLISATLCQATEEHMCGTVAGYGVALDLTLRDVQGRTKRAGQPWEKTKGFDNSCPLSGFTPVAEFNDDPQDTMFGLAVNGELRRHGTMADMVHHVVPLIVYMSRFFTLKTGDIVLTKTPAGIGPLNGGDELAINFRGQALTTRVL